jgi:hypothetical protein
MASLTDLFNPSFLMFLGILVLVIALLVVYFESKMRDQNHKIASMLSLVSTLAEDMNSMKLGLNQIALSTNYGGANFADNNLPFSQNLGSTNHNEKFNESINLIEVSDDEDEDEDGDEDEDENNDEDEQQNEDEDNVDEESLDLDDINDIDENSNHSSINISNNHLFDDNTDHIKVIKINISKEESDSEENGFELDMADDLADLDCDFEPTDDIPEISEKYTEEILNLKYDEVNNEIKEDKTLGDNAISTENIIKADTDLKTITINLGDLHQAENIDFKKLQLPKLRSIAVEKGLTSSLEAQKLKKQDLLKLLGAE